MNHLSRRTFLATVAATSAARQLLSHNFTPQPFKKAVKIGMVQEGDTLLEKFKLLKELGFDGVEMDSPNGYSTKEVLEARDKSGLPIHGVVDSTHWRKTFNHADENTRDEAIQDLKTALQDAHDFGASTVLVVPAVVNKGEYYGVAWKRAHEAISSQLDLAEKLGVKIAFENVWNNFLISPVEMSHWIDTFDSNQVGAYFDVGNILRYGWPEHWIRELGHRILKIDVKEYSRTKANEEGIWAGFSAELLEGDCDWPVVMKELRNLDYDGWFTAEIGGGGRKRLQQIATNMDKILAS
ncbi:MAG TPA: sugar phosphate isomerase/epimerase family protein [Planctomycetota bacterium]|jgi:hexulose-6-phosphate isomerase|nr:xylose isomerase [Planctomycetota bacterium]MDP7246850.1 sugar phosphate isomerase/epimerase family protein [Planctomycetota bacterium]MDP7561112.1 sugar phosphate isomerase/epimerase family protein [Planctomycetota bacterium]HJM39591.1 sugar phosphate isomerase/epimerase family protein [Planctomycetota bacterium]|tara:strand:+ start:20075 stop:20962 length:888 start_codon:yes stop_codon:yes gene_type:complete